MSWPALHFVNRVILEHSYAHLFAYWGCATTTEFSGVTDTTIWPAKLRICTVWPVTEILFSPLEYRKQKN